MEHSTILNRKVIGPGGMYFGDDEDIIYTLLGSCVAVTLWHPTLLYAGMCHIVLPDNGELDCHTEHPKCINCHNKYANCAIRQLSLSISKYNTSPLEYTVGVYGGGNMFSSISMYKHQGEKKKSVGERNFYSVLSLLKKHKLNYSNKDVGGETARKLNLHRKTGKVELEHVVMNDSNTEKDCKIG